MKLRELVIELTPDEYRQLRSVKISGRGRAQLFRRLQPLINLKLPIHPRTEGVRVHVTDPSLIAYCARYAEGFNEEENRSVIRQQPDVAIDMEATLDAVRALTRTKE